MKQKIDSLLQQVFALLCVCTAVSLAHKMYQMGMSRLVMSVLGGPIGIIFGGGQVLMVGFLTILYFWCGFQILKGQLGRWVKTLLLIGPIFWSFGFASQFVQFAPYYTLYFIFLIFSYAIVSFLITCSELQSLPNRWAILSYSPFLLIGSAYAIFLPQLRSRNAV